MPTDQSALEFDDLLRLSEGMRAGRGLDDLLTALIRQAAELPGVDTVRILLLDAKKQHLVAHGGIFPTADEETLVPIGEGFAGRIAQLREPLLVQDLQDFPVFTQALRESGVRCAVGVPLIAGDALVGVMHIGSRVPAAFTAAIVPSLEGIADRVAAAVASIQAEQALSERESRFRMLYERAPVGLCFIGLGESNFGHYRNANPALARMLGHSVWEFDQLQVADILSGVDTTSAATDLRRLADGEIDHYVAERQAFHADGRTVWLRSTVSAVIERGVPAHAVAFVEDVTDRKCAELELERRALTDALTGLANRDLLIDHLQLAVQQQERYGTRVALIYIDVDRFKDVNDAYGHDVGDWILREIADRLAAAVRAADTAGRLGGDEFAVVCPQLDSDGDLEVLIRRLMAALSPPIAARDGRAYEIAVSIGGALSDDQVGAGELLRRADVAMYDAKRRGRGRWSCYSTSLDDAGRQRETAFRLLRAALENGWFRLHYQPIVNLPTGAVTGVEALLRIDHPTQGLIAPGQFVDALEDSSLAEPIEKWILRAAARQVAEWDCLLPGAMSVNVSGRLASSGLLTPTVLMAATSANVDPRLLRIEMTERALVKGGPNVVEDLNALSRAGVSVALDDFGTGFSSLSYLQHFPIDTLKIDRSFIQRVVENDKDKAIVSAVIALGAALRMEVVAEGVETHEQAQLLASLGCPRAQGYHFGVPAVAGATPFRAGEQFVNS